MEKTSEILLWRRGEGRGPVISLRDYELVAREIFRVVRASPYEVIDLGELIDQLRGTLSGACRGNVQWFILHVKEDLEQRGWIKTKVNRDRVQTISLVKSRPAIAKKNLIRF